MMYRLISLTGPTKGRRISVTKEPMVFGSDAGCSVILDDAEVAKKHAVIEHRRDGLLIRDLGSMNRILVNQREVREAHIKHGDMFEIGRTRFLVQAVVQAEVAGGPRSSRKTRIRIGLAVATLIAAVAGGYVAYLHDWSGELPAAEVDVPAKTARAKAAAPDTVPPVTDEIRKMRDDLEHVTMAMKRLAQQQVPIVITNTIVAAAAAESADPIRVQSEHWLEDARALAAEGKVEEADTLLARIQIADPPFSPAYLERAALYEKRGMLEKAIGQWSYVLRASTKTPEYAKAAAERARLGHEVQRTRLASAPVVKIGDIHQRRFQATGDYDDMRIFDIDVVPAEPEAEFDDNLVRVDVWFFDADPKTGKVSPSSAVVPHEPLKLGPLDPSEAARSVTATYVVPKGFRNAGEEGEQFNGYVVHLYYDDALQDVIARPQTLLNAPAGAAPEGQAGEEADTNQPTAAAPAKESI